jgi:hypothetical protein
MSSPLREHRLVCILPEAIVRTRIAATATYEFHLLPLSVEPSEFMATARKEQIVKNAMFRNALTSAIQVNVPPRDASYFIGIKLALCEPLRRRKAVICRVMRMMRRSMMTMSTPTIWVRSSSAIMPRLRIPMLCNRITSSFHDSRSLQLIQPIPIKDWDFGIERNQTMFFCYENFFLWSIPTLAQAYGWRMEENTRTRVFWFGSIAMKLVAAHGIKKIRKLHFCLTFSSTAQFLISLSFTCGESQNSPNFLTQMIHHIT